MKYLTKYLCIAATICMMTACYSDDSTPLNSTEVNSIIVGGFESSYTMTAYVGEHLTINPNFEGYNESELKFQWMLINEKTGSTDTNGKKIEPIDLGTDKNLDYEVNLAPGVYQIRLYTTVTATGLQTISYATLNVQTEFSKGFYILKETADGNTELDLVTKDFNVASDLLAATQGSSMKGKPVNLCQNYIMYCINPDNDEMEGVNAITVTSDSKDFAVLRTNDLKQIFNKKNIGFDEMPADEQVYGIYPSIMYTFMLTSKGVYTTSAAGSYGSPCTGQFGLPEPEAACSAYYYYDFNGYGGGTFWNPVTHSLTTYDYNQFSNPLIRKDRTGADVTQNLNGYECLHTGFNFMSRTSKGVFILKDGTTGKRYIYQTVGQRTSIYLNKNDELTGHMATASYYATNGKSAAYTYCVDDGKLFACNLSTGNYEEVELRPQGISASETITFVANQFYYNSFDYLIVGTQSGQNYKLYFYEINGGAPTGNPIQTVEGQGTVKKVRYMNPTFNDIYWMFGYHIFNAND